MRWVTACAVTTKTFYLEYEPSRSFGGNFYCGKHLAEMFAQFDPTPGDQVRRVDGEQRDLHVLARDGQWLTLQRVGRADLPQEREHVANLWPGVGGGTRFTRACGPKPKEETQ